MEASSAVDVEHSNRDVAPAQQQLSKCRLTLLRRREPVMQPCAGIRRDAATERGVLLDTPSRQVGRVPAKAAAVVGRHGCVVAWRRAVAQAAGPGRPLHGLGPGLRGRGCQRRA